MRKTELIGLLGCDVGVEYYAVRNGIEGIAYRFGKVNLIKWRNLRLERQSGNYYYVPLNAIIKVDLINGNDGGREK